MERGTCSNWGLHTHAHICALVHIPVLPHVQTHIHKYIYHHTQRYTKRKENEKIHKIIKTSVSPKSNKRLIQMKVAIHETLHEVFRVSQNSGSCFWS